uniref:Tetratricopeptide repeat family protein n=1 Tax=uncultured bacterium contig00032 TaxID=1181521 RepID=A0A806JY62_9BACT|nr:tetratricopeptide repeat family protein [uncultured bacterium contig00032]
MSYWVKAKDQDFVTNKKNCCDDFMVNENGQMYCNKYDLSIEMKPHFMTLFCKVYHVDVNSCCWVKSKCDAVLNEEKKKVNDMIKIFGEHIEENPNDPVNYKNRASMNAEIVNNMVFQMKNNPNWEKALNEHCGKEIMECADKAIKDLTKIIEELNPNDAEAYAERGSIYISINQLKEAHDNFNKALDIDPQCKQVFIYRGAYYNDNKEYEKAITELEQGLKYHPNDDGLLTILNIAKNAQAEEYAKRRRQEEAAERERIEEQKDKRRKIGRGISVLLALFVAVMTFIAFISSDAGIVTTVIITIIYSIPFIVIFFADEDSTAKKIIFLCIAVGLNLLLLWIGFRESGNTEEIMTESENGSIREIVALIGIVICNLASCTTAVIFPKK